MKLILKNVRLRYASLFEKQVNELSDIPKFNCRVTFEKDSDTAKVCKEAIKTISNEKWKDKAPLIMKQMQAENGLFLKDGDLKADKPGHDGLYYVNASNAKDIMLKDQARNDVAKGSGLLYPGCYVNVVLDVWAQDNTYGKKINATLMGVQMVKHGDAFESFGASESDFDLLETEEEDFFN